GTNLGGNKPRTRHRQLASTNGPSRRGQRQKIGKDGQWNEDKIQDNSGSMRSLHGRKAGSTTIPHTSHKSNGASRTHPQRSMWTNRTYDFRRNKLLPPFHRRFHQDDSHLSSQEKMIGGRVGEVQRVQAGSGKANGKGDQTIENRWRRGVRKMDGTSPQGIRYYSRDNSSVQSRPERRCRTGKSNDYGTSQGYHCRSKTRQTTLDGNRRYSRLPQKSQPNNRSRHYPVRIMAWRQTKPVSSQDHRINSICSHSEGKAHQTRHPLSQGNYGRLWWRHKPVQGMGSHKEGCCGIKG